MSRYLGFCSVSSCFAQIMICMQVITVFIIVMVKGLRFIGFSLNTVIFLTLILMYNCKYILCTLK